MVMAKPPPYLEGDQYYMKDYFKPKYNHHHKTKSLSFFASLLSLFIYTCVLYIFKLSPSTLFNNNIFWFFMSNTLILIIAADYGAFSSSNKQRQNLYEEYVKHSQAARKSFYVSPSYVPKYDEQCIISPKQELEGESLQEKKETISDQIVPERVLEIVVQNNKPKKDSEFCSNDEEKAKLHLDDGYGEFDEEKAIVPAARIYRRSKSDRHNYRAKKVVMEERMRRSETIKAEPTKVVEEEGEENDEFSKMTNEDLNRRVEEFIQKFNKQIRLQATRN